jgi:hypothetical protein
MVGHPKHLSDLEKVEADVRIICRECRYEEDWTRDSLGRFLHRTGGSRVWTEITRGMRCRRLGCPSTSLYAIAVPFARKPPNMPRMVSALDALRISVALQILRDAAQVAERGGAATLPVKLALYVLHPHLRDPELVREYWSYAERPIITNGHNCFRVLRWIENRLRERGWLAPEVHLRPAPTLMMRETAQQFEQRMIAERMLTQDDVT